MTPAAYRHLLVLVEHAVEDNPPDEQVRRLSKGLSKALKRWLAMSQPVDSAQARTGTPRLDGLAPVNASLAIQSGATRHGEASRPQRPDSDR